MYTLTFYNDERAAIWRMDAPDLEAVMGAVRMMTSELEYSAWDIRTPAGTVIAQSVSDVSGELEKSREA